MLTARALAGLGVLNEPISGELALGLVRLVQVAVQPGSRFECGGCAQTKTNDYEYGKKQNIHRVALRKESKADHGAH